MRASLEEVVEVFEEPLEIGGALFWPQTEMPATIRSSLVNGKPRVDYVGGIAWAKLYESAARRGKRLMCQGCLLGLHPLCESEDCPCVCNDSDFRWARRPAV